MYQLMFDTMHISFTSPTYCSLNLKHLERFLKKKKAFLTNYIFIQNTIYNYLLIDFIMFIEKVS